MKNKSKSKNNNEMKISLLSVLINFAGKISLLLSSVWGWIGSIAIALTTYFLPLKTIFLIIFTVVLIDMLLGIFIHRKEIQSSKLRESLLKFLIYIILIALTYAIEKEVGLNILYKIVFGIASLTELYSIAAQCLVICPGLPFLKLFKNILEVEISKKANVSQEKVENILEDKEKIEEKITEKL